MAYYKAYPHHIHASCLLGSWLTECQMWCNAEVALLNLEGSKLPINSVKKKVFVSAFTFSSAWYSPASPSVGPPQKQLLASGLGTKQSSLGAKGLAYLLDSNWLYLSHSTPSRPVLVLYCCITNDHKFSYCKQHTFINSAFVGQESGYHSGESSARALTRPQWSYQSGCLLIWSLSPFQSSHSC